MTSKLRCIGLLVIAGLMSTGACDGDDSVVPEPDPIVEPDPGAAPDPSSMPENPPEQLEPTGTLLRGTITRTGAALGTGDAIGSLYVLVHDSDPLTASSQVTLTDMLIIEDVDMSGNDIEILYEIKNIDPSSSDYYVTAILDDNATIVPEDVQSIAPDGGDLLSVLQTGTSPAIKIDVVGTYELDLVLNAVWPG